MRIVHFTFATLLVLIVAGSASGQMGEKIADPTGKYLVWEDYKFEVNQYGDLGRDWPTPKLFWEQYAKLQQKARANTKQPNTLRSVLLVVPHIEATAVRTDGDHEVVIGTKKASMSPADIKSALDQWRQFEDMVYVFSGGNAWLRTDIKVVDEPLKVQTGENWNFWTGPQREFLDKYIPFDRGDYESYNAVFCSNNGLNADIHGGTLGAVCGVKGCGTSDTAWFGEGRWTNRTGYVFLHEWLNQQCSATSNMMPYPDNEALWNNYVLHKVGYREDTDLDDWPWITARRDVMRFVIRPGMWRRWSGIDPYESRPIDRWVVFGPTAAGRVRELTSAAAPDGRIVELPMEKYSQFNLADAKSSGQEKPAIREGTYYFRTYVKSPEKKEVRLWAAADERFQVWLNGVMIRDGWGWNYSEDDGRLFEKASYPTLEAGINTLVLLLPNTNDKVEFRVRFCDTDGSGRPPAGVVASPTLLKDETPVSLAVPAATDFRDPRFHKWTDVNDDPWLTLPRLDEAALRDLTGIASLEIVTKGTPRKDRDGNDYTPEQHLFMRVPKEAVASPWISSPAEDNAKLNNDFDYNWKSLAWLRVPGRSGPEKDILLLRFDAAEPLMHLLRTKGRPANESIVGWVLVEHKLAYVVLVNLDVDESPATALGLLSRQPQ